MVNSSGFIISVAKIKDCKNLDSKLWDLGLSTPCIFLALVHFSILKIFDDFLMIRPFISSTALLSLSLGFRIQSG